MMYLNLALAAIKGRSRPSSQGAVVEALTDRNEASALADLQMHWDEAYVIDFDGDVWSARFRTSTDALCARTSSDLRELIRADYVHRQRPRRPTSSNGSARTADNPAADDPSADDPSADERRSADNPAADNPAADADVFTNAADASDSSARALGTIDFAAIRGERMST